MITKKQICRYNSVKKGQITSKATKMIIRNKPTMGQEH